MVIPIVLALTVLGLVTFAVRAAAGPKTALQTVEVPARPSPMPGASAPGGTPNPGQSTVRPGPPEPPKLDSSTPKVKVNDLDGRFDVTIPRGWLGIPTVVPDSVAWQPLGQDAQGRTIATDFRFIVRWFDSTGCELEQCAAEHVETLLAGDPRLMVKTKADSLAGRPAVRLDPVLVEGRAAG
ncbi:MAG: hypothetical protein WKF86_11025, partial [Acidimicrobiales bacterium]